MKFVSVVWVCLSVAAALAQTAPQQQPPVFRSTTTVVPLTVTVLDEKGLPVTDLKASEFTVYENKQSREIVNFFPQAFAPGPVQPVLVSTVARGRLDGGLRHPDPAPFDRPLELGQGRDPRRDGEDRRGKAPLGR